MSLDGTERVLASFSCAVPLVIEADEILRWRVEASDFIESMVSLRFGVCFP